MSNYSDYIKSLKEKDIERFYGNVVRKSNKYFYFDHYKNNNEVIIITQNIKRIKDSPVMIVGSNAQIYLKGWQLRPVYNFYLGINDTWAVKLNRNYYKPYVFRTQIEDYSFDKTWTFDDFVKLAKEQDRQKTQWAEGRMG